MPRSLGLLQLDHLLAAACTIQKSRSVININTINTINIITNITNITIDDDRNNVAGDYLQEKYNAATRVRSTRSGRLKVHRRNLRIPTVTLAMAMRTVVMLILQANDLVFIKNSPDYCHSNHTIGSLGEHHYGANGADGDEEEAGYTVAESNNIEFATSRAAENYPEMKRETEIRCSYDIE